MLTKDQALAILRSHKAELRALGVRRAAVFGSVSRGEAQPDSDLDIMIELENADRLTVYDYVGIKRQIADLFPVKTDVVALDSMKPSASASAVRDAVYAF